MPDLPYEPLYPGTDLPAEIAFASGATSADTPIVIVFPGGAYCAHALEHEGSEVVAALVAAGFDAALVRYRLGPVARRPDMIQDAARAVRLTRQRFPDRPVACLGFSAGGHLVASLGVYHQETFVDGPLDPLAAGISARPDAIVLGYPVIELHGPCAHEGSRLHLLGPDADEALVRSLSLSEHVGPDCPPVFLFHTATDSAVPPENSLQFASACARRGVPVELHLYAEGPHGVGLASEILGARDWFAAAVAFLRRTLC